MPVYLLENEFYFGRENPYGYLVDYERFVFFTRSVVEMLRNADFSSECWFPDVIHGHDWPVGLMPLWLRYTYGDDPSVGSLPFVYTLHNTGFPGQYGHRALSVAGLLELGIYKELGESENRISFMARGILGADVVSTVSPEHAEELTDGRYAEDLFAAISRRQDALQGVVHGIDYTLYNPAFDDTLHSRFDRNNILTRRLPNKGDLQKRLGFAEDAQVPLLGVVGRLVGEKGVELLVEALPRLLQHSEAQIVMLGRPGDQRYWEYFRGLAKENPRRVHIAFRYDDMLARRIFAGSDIFLMPSAHESGGLHHMLAMHYGSIPVARRTGAIVDTMESWNQETSLGKGFLFDAFDVDEFLGQLESAIGLYRSEPETWHRLQRHNMSVDFSWDKPASQYVELYKIARENCAKRSKLAKGEPISRGFSETLTQALLDANEFEVTLSRVEYLGSMADAARDLLGCDGVLVWLRDETRPHLLRLEASSVETVVQGAGGGAPQTTCPAVPGDSERSWSWQYIYRRDHSERALRSQLGFLDSSLAREHNWAVQMSVPVSCHETVIGRCDAFSRDSSFEFSDRGINALAVIANLIGFSVQRGRATEMSTRLLEIAREVSRVDTVEGMAEILLRHAKSVACAEDVYLYVPNGRIFAVSNCDEFSAKDEHGAEPVVTETETYIDVGEVRMAGGNCSLRYESVEGVSKQLSSVRVDLRRDATNIGRLRLIRKGAARLPRDKEQFLLEMSGQVAEAICAAQKREEQDQRRADQLGKLASSLIERGSFDLLLEEVVNTIAEVLQVDAATLYLADEKYERLVIQAGYGYQKPLVAAKASYEWGEGVTGRIAETNKPFGANSLEDLREEGGSEKGKYDDLQGGKRPTSFYGAPLNVKGLKQPIGVLKVESLVERPFTSEDILLIEMMGNVIATVVYNAKVDQVRIGKIVNSLGTLARPQESAPAQLLLEFAQSGDRRTCEMLANALCLAIGSEEDLATEEGIALLRTGASAEIYHRISEMAQGENVRHRFRAFHAATRAKQVAPERRAEVFELSHLWCCVQEAVTDSQAFRSASRQFVDRFASLCNASVMEETMSGDWYGVLLDTTRTFEGTYLPNRLPIALNPAGIPRSDNLDELRSLVVDLLEEQKRVILPVWCDSTLLERTRELLRTKIREPHRIDTIVLDLESLQSIGGASRADIQLQHAVLRQVSLSRISPYIIVGPTDERAFFGREEQLTEIVEGAGTRSFALVGGRRVGKSSILRQLHRVRLPAAGYRSALFDLGRASTCETLMDQEITDWRPDEGSRERIDFRTVLSNPPSGMPLVLLLDETDKLIEPDSEQEWRFFRNLRGLATSGHLQVVFAGERTLRGAIRDSESPHFNFANEIVVGRLEPLAVRELVTRPMRQLDLSFTEEDEIVRLIYEFTSGHPNVVQRLCKRLIERLNEVIRLGFVSRRFPDYVPQTTSSISISLPERN